MESEQAQTRLTRRLRLSDEAKASFRTLSIADASGSPYTAVAFVMRLQDECETLAELPGTLGRARSELGDGLRSFALGNHVIFFRYVGDVFEVVEVLDGRRDLGSYVSDE